MAAMRRWSFAVLLASSCLVTPRPEPLPKAPQNLNTCLLGAVGRRAACRGDAACEREVSEGWAYRCYAHLYRSHPDGAEVSMATLGPCFWDASPTLQDADDTARKTNVIRQTCAALDLPEPKRAHCRQELRFAIDDLCLRGDVWLTGAGP